jgi:hypothetical protein
MMNWIPENRYKIQAVYQFLEGKHLLLFNLSEYEMVVPEIITLDDGKTVRKQKKFYPEDWRESFGRTLLEHTESYKVDMNTHYMLNNAKDGSERDFTMADQNLQGHEPTADEIILKPYRSSTRSPESENSKR